MKQPIQKKVKEIEQQVIKWRRFLHRYSEVSFSVSFSRVFGKELDGEKHKQEIKKRTNPSLTRNIILLLLVLLIVTQSQGFIGVGVHTLFKIFNFTFDFYPTFGTEVAAGFSGWTWDRGCDR